MAEVKKSFDMIGMHCASCVRVIGKTLQKIEGVQEATVNLATNKATVHYDSHTSEQSMASAVKKAGYVLVVEQDHMAMVAPDKLKENVVVAVVLVVLTTLMMIREIVFTLNTMTKYLKEQNLMVMG